MQEIKSGKILLNFLTEEFEGFTEELDTNNSNLGKLSTTISEYDCFQAHKRIMGIIGVLDCSINTSPQEEILNFRHKAKQTMPGTSSICCMVFNSNLQKTENDIFYFPTQDNSSLIVEVKKAVSTFTLKILEEISKAIQREAPV